MSSENPSFHDSNGREYFHVWVRTYEQTLPDGTTVKVMGHWRKQYFAPSSLEGNDG
jgi:hypothetical protein